MACISVSRPRNWPGRNSGPGDFTVHQLLKNVKRS
jgi:hypothetical protein